VRTLTRMNLYELVRVSSYVSKTTDANYTGTNSFVFYWYK